MHQMKVFYLGELRTEAQHLDSQNIILTDAPKDNQGKGEAFSPTDLMSTSLASCMLTIAAMKGRTLGIELQGVTVEVQKKMQAAPRKVSEIVLRFEKCILSLIAKCIWPETCNLFFSVRL
jgi:uncharacterized OsmC-like protein